MTSNWVSSEDVKLSLDDKPPLSDYPRLVPLSAACPKLLQIICCLESKILLWFSHGVLSHIFAKLQASLIEGDRQMQKPYHMVSSCDVILGFQALAWRGRGLSAVVVFEKKGKSRRKEVLPILRLSLECMVDVSEAE
jgi:hypothetical protein